MQDVDLKVIGPRVTLDFGRTKLNSNSLEERSRELLPLLFSLVSADSAWANRSVDEQDRYHQAYNAQNMVYQAALYATMQRAGLLIAIADGSESIADHGFPEFQENREFDV